ncbi:MAG: AzlC family ABC transporter permease [Ruminococcus sp.]|nr:AzlC family ABC transporter permease [Ruminococcus sp.]MDY3895985.1 AzlC family ABC transporter permease [Candidatus Fimenecus sp.]
MLILEKHKKALRAAFPVTLPILAGFLFLGTAYGILMVTSGFSPILAILMSLLVFAGSMQYVAVNLLLGAFNPLSAFLLAFTVNARHLFYGISMLDRLKKTGRAKPIIIFTMCDETFSVLCGTTPPDDVDDTLFMLFVSLLDYFYWAAGTALGALAGSFITFNTEGLDFALTALFIVIFVNQWKESKNHIPTLLGLFASIICLIVFGSQNFLIPSMVLITVSLFAYKPLYNKKEAVKQ